MRATRNVCKSLFLLILFLIFSLSSGCSSADKGKQRSHRSIFNTHRLIGHAFGNIRGKTYPNSFEAFHESFERGRRIFEVDLSVTGDGEVVCFHNKNEKQYGLTKPIWKTTLAEFKGSKILGKYRPMNLKDLVTIMDKHKDIFIVTDTKENIKGDTDYMLRKFVEESTEVDREIPKRIIPQIYRKNDYFRVSKIYPFSEIILTLYKWKNANDEEVIDFIKGKKNITALTVHKNRFNPILATKVTHMGKKIFVHTVNDPEEVKRFSKKGASGFYTDSFFPDNQEQYTEQNIR